jgi:hypothetical protein
MIQLILVGVLFLTFIVVAVFNIINDRDLRRKSKIEETHDKIKSGLNE